MLFRYMMENPDLNREFVDRCSIYMGDFLNERGVREIWDPMYETIKSEIPYYRQLMPEADQIKSYDAELADARLWMSERTAYFYKHLAASYKLGTPIPMTINQSVEQASGMTVRFNGVKLSRGTFDGQFYRERNVTLEGEAPEGWEIAGWHIITESETGTKENFVEGATCSFTMPKCKSLTINAELTDVSGINTLSSPNWKWFRDGKRLLLVSVPVGMKVQLYDLRGMLIHTVVSDGTEISIPLSTSQFHILKVGDKTIKI